MAVYLEYVRDITSMPMLRGAEVELMPQQPYKYKHPCFIHIANHRPKEVPTVKEGPSSVYLRICTIFYT